MWRIAVLHHRADTSPLLAALRAALAARGWVDGDTCRLDVAGADGQLARLPVLVRQLLARRPAVVVAIGARAALAAQAATARVPVLHAVVLEPAHIGLVAPNVTGVTTFDPRQAGRQLRLLRRLVPGLAHVGCMADGDAPMAADGRSPLVAQWQAAGQAQGLRITCAMQSSVEAGIEPAFQRLVHAGVQAVVALEVPSVLSRLGDLGRLAVHHRLPMLSPAGWPDGGVAMQGAALHDAMEPLARALDALGRGAAVADLPLQRVRRRRLVIHLDRARAISLPVPGHVLARATECHAPCDRRRAGGQAHQEVP